MQPTSLSLEPIGYIRTPHSDRASAPRQPYASQGVRGVIELLPRRGFEHALDDLSGWEYIWVIFWFHLNKGWRPKVLPPRSTVRRGLFATRTPHRPNPLGLSVLKLESIDGLRVHVLNVDLIDGTPILDIKPYVPWADSIATARTGWFVAPETDATLSSADPVAPYEVSFDSHALAQLTWLFEQHQIDLESQLRHALELGPNPHPYRRIKQEPAGTYLLARKEWRARFRVDGTTVEVFEVFSGYRSTALNDPDPALDPHRAFVARWKRLDVVA